MTYDDNPIVSYYQWIGIGLGMAGLVSIKCQSIL